MVSAINGAEKMLTDTKLRNLKPQDKLYKVNDRDGLYVAVSEGAASACRLTAWLMSEDARHGLAQYCNAVRHFCGCCRECRHETQAVGAWGVEQEAVRARVGNDLRSEI